MVENSESHVKLLAAALNYAELGYPVFPLVPGASNPLTKRGFKDASTDPDQIEAWWAEHSIANIGIHTEGLLVVDIDGADNPWLADVPEKQLELAAAPISLTPGGGRHLLFRQPENAGVRNSASKIATHVDIRADGGYIVAPPSMRPDGQYRWLEGDLDYQPTELPIAPEWLVIESTSKVSSSNPDRMTSGNVIPRGVRNSTLTQYAGKMRRGGMTEAEFGAALHQINSDRCEPVLNASEVDRIIRSVGTYQPDATTVAAIEHHELQDQLALQTPPLIVKALMSKFTALREPVIEGIIRRGETMNLIAAPKAGKSWLSLDLAISVATGRPWLGCFETHKSNVLIIDNELHPETSASRVPLVAEAREIPLSEFEQGVSIHNVRGQLWDILSFGAFFDRLEPGEFGVIVLDAFYRFMPADCDENDNGAMARIYNEIDRHANRLGCCFVLIHHTSKGSQSYKSVTDVGAGAGSQSRAADAHLILRPHKEEGAVVLDAAVRSWPPVKSVCLRWEFPTWELDTSFDPADLATSPRRDKKKDKPQAPEMTVEQFVTIFVTDKPRTKDEIKIAATSDSGLSGRKFDHLLSNAESTGLVHRWKYGSNQKQCFATLPQPDPKGSCS